MQVRLTYYSRALREMSLQDIQNILQVARDNNADADVCGMLSYQSQWFLQTLEGDRETVNELFLEIADDPRHEDVVIVGYEYIAEPLFSGWRMGYAANSGAVAQCLQAFGLSEFSPPSMAPDQALQFLQALADEDAENAA